MSFWEKIFGKKTVGGKETVQDYQNAEPVFIKTSDPEVVDTQFQSEQNEQEKEAVTEDMAEDIVSDQGADDDSSSDD